MTTIRTENPNPNVPYPAGAVRVCGWDDVEHGDPHRYWVGRSWVIDREDCEDIKVWIDGVQRPDSVDRYIVVNQLHADYPLRSSAVARQLAWVLTAAADEFDSLT